jgi:hypothetical protein
MPVGMTSRHTSTKGWRALGRQARKVFDLGLVMRRGLRGRSDRSAALRSNASRLARGCLPRRSTSVAPARRWGSRPAPASPSPASRSVDRRVEEPGAAGETSSGERSHPRRLPNLTLPGSRRRAVFSDPAQRLDHVEVPVPGHRTQASRRADACGRDAEAMVDRDDDDLVVADQGRGRDLMLSVTIAPWIRAPASALPHGVRHPRHAGAKTSR